MTTFQHKKPDMSVATLGWNVELKASLKENKFNACVGSVLVSETEAVRVWHLYIAAGKRCEFHRHVLNYFWTSLADGRARNYFESGEISETDHYKGQTKHLSFDKGEYMLHCVENIGDTDLIFVTVEHKHGANRPLPVPDSIRQI